MVYVQLFDNHCALCGVTIIALPFSIARSFSPPPNSCENRFDRGGNISHPFFGLFRILVSRICWWTLQAHDNHNINMEHYFSGVDVLLIGIGACILLSDLSLSICPATCAHLFQWNENNYNYYEKCSRIFHQPSHYECQPSHCERKPSLKPSHIQISQRFNGFIILNKWFITEKDCYRVVSEP